MRAVKYSEQQSAMGAWMILPDPRKSTGTIPEVEFLER
jgi:hypothetical protein